MESDIQSMSHMAGFIFGGFFGGFWDFAPRLYNVTDEWLLTDYSSVGGNVILMAARFLEKWSF